jgi:hypothetical protein
MRISYQEACGPVGFGMNCLLSDDGIDGEKNRLRGGQRATKDDQSGVYRVVMLVAGQTESRMIEDGMDDDYDRSSDEATGLKVMLECGGELRLVGDRNLKGQVTHTNSK